MARNSFAPETLRQVAMMSKLTAGLRQGWLPAEGYDELAAYLDEAGESSLRRMLGGIERRANG